MIRFCCFIIIFLGIFLQIPVAGNLAENSALAATVDAQDEQNDAADAAPDSIGYQTLNWASQQLEEIIFKIYEGFSKILSPILYLITAFTILWVIVGFVIDRPPHFFTVLSIIVAIIFLRSVVLDINKFDSWIYTPVMQAMFNLPAFILEIVTAGKFENLSSNPLENMYLHMDATIGAMMNVSEKIMESSNDFSDAAIWAKAFLLQIIFFILQVVFAYMFLISLWSIHLLFAAMPLALCLAVHPRTRKYIYNIINYGVAFLITPAMAAIAMAVTILMLADITVQANEIAELTDDIEQLPAQFFLRAMFLGIISILFHLKSTSCATWITASGNAVIGQLSSKGLASAGIGRGGNQNILANEIQENISKNTSINSSYESGRIVGKGGKIIENIGG